MSPERASSRSRRSRFEIAAARGKLLAHVASELALVLEEQAAHVVKLRGLEADGPEHPLEGQLHEVAQAGIAADVELLTSGRDFTAIAGHGPLRPCAVTR